MKAIERPLPRSALLWLLVAGVLVFMPHHSHLPWFFWGMALITTGWRWLMHRGQLPYPNAKTKMAAVVLVGGGVVAGFSGHYSLESAVGFFVAMSLLKTLEMRTQRDGYIVVFLCFFLLATGFLFEQEVLWGLLGIVATWVLIGTLVALQLGQQGTGAAKQPGFAVVSRFATGILLISLPLMLVVYLLFPRFGPLWSIKLQSEQAMTGLSDSMSPGDIASLSQSDELAFRATFESGQQPPRNQLYWRALVLDQYDGRSWQRSGSRRNVTWYPEMPEYQVEQLRRAGVEGVTRYEIIQEPTGQNWLFTLRDGGSMEPGIGLTSSGVLVDRRPVFQRKRYRGYGIDGQYARHQLGYVQRRLNLQLPDDGNPRTRAWAQQLWQQNPTADVFVQALLDHFAASFTYTLKPPVLGDDDIDEFLFDTQRGFCAHFAGAFVYAARLVGIPARVVTGYQGGEWNNAENYLTVRQYDAHGWAEIWLDGVGWVRVDPTAAVAPSRIELGLEQALAGEGSFMENSLIKPGQILSMPWLNQLRLKLESVNYLWHRWVLSYDGERQKSMLRSIFNRTDYLYFIWWIIGAVIAVFVVIAALMLAKGPARSRSAERRGWDMLLADCEKAGIAVAASESPLSVLQRLQRQYPSARPALLQLATLMEQRLYAAPSQADAVSTKAVLAAIKQARRALKRAQKLARKQAES